MQGIVIGKNIEQFTFNTAPALCKVGDAMGAKRSSAQLDAKTIRRH